MCLRSSLRALAFTLSFLYGMRLTLVSSVVFLALFLIVEETNFSLVTPITLDTDNGPAQVKRSDGRRNLYVLGLPFALTK